MPKRQNGQLIIVQRGAPPKARITYPQPKTQRTRWCAVFLLAAKRKNSRVNRVFARAPSAMLNVDRFAGCSAVRRFDSLLSITLIPFLIAGCTKRCAVFLLVTRRKNLDIFCRFLKIPVGGWGFGTFFAKNVKISIKGLKF